MSTCTYPLTGLACVSHVYTDLAVIDVGAGGAVVRETFGISYDELADRIDAPLRRGEAIRTARRCS